MSVLERIAAGLPAGAVVNDGGVTWLKISDHWWESNDGASVNNWGIDHRLRLGATVVIDVIDLETELIHAYELEEGDYVVVTAGFSDEGEHVGDEPFFEPNRSHQLWRAAGWTWHGEQSSTVLLDAPEAQMIAADLARDPENGGDAEPIHLGVGPDDVIRLVVPGQDHNTWSYDYAVALYEPR